MSAMDAFRTATWVGSSSPGMERLALTMIGYLHFRDELGSGLIAGENQRNDAVDGARGDSDLAHAQVQCFRGCLEFGLHSAGSNAVVDQKSTLSRGDC